MIRPKYCVSALLAAAVTLESCALLPCGQAETRYAAQLLFGRAIGAQGEVSDAEWQDFLATAVTPAFPEGLTVTDTQGQWRDSATGALVRERSKVVTLLVEDAAAVRPRLEAIADAYKQRFHQDAVGIVITPACVAFR